GSLTDALQLGPVGDGQPQPKAFGHFRLPLVEQRPGRRDDQDAVGPAAGDQLRDDETCLDGLAQADIIGKEQSAPGPPPAAVQAGGGRWVGGLALKAPGGEGGGGVGREPLWKEKGWGKEGRVGGGGGGGGFAWVDGGTTALNGGESPPLIPAEGTACAAQPEQ